MSGVYIAHLVRNDNGGDSQIPFVVRDDSSHSDVILQTSDATWQAYNNYGGNSLYKCTVQCPAGNPQAYKAAYAVSYNRPWDGSFATDGGLSYFWYAEYQMVRFMEENGYNVSYTSQADIDQAPALLKNHKLFVSSGHDEYWSGPRAHRRGVGARRRRQPRLLQRQRDVLEDALDELQRRLEHALPHAGLLQGDALQRPVDPQDPDDLDGHLDRSALQPSGGRRAAVRMRSPASSSSSTRAPPTSRCRRSTASCASGAAPRPPASPAARR